MRERLEAFLALCRRYDQETRKSGYSAYAEDLNSQIETEIPTTKEIVKLLDPGLVRGVHGPDSVSGTAVPRQAINQALGILRDQEEWKANLAPTHPRL
jgi:hypothetical protein